MGGLQMNILASPPLLISRPSCHFCEIRVTMTAFGRALGFISFNQWGRGRLLLLPAPWGETGVPTLLELQTTKYRFPTATYLELRNERLITFMWGFAIAVAPLVINFLVYGISSVLGQKHLQSYFNDNIADATFTSFSIAAVAFANSYFNNAKPVTYTQLSIFTHVCIFSIAILALINFVVHVICTVSSAKDPNVYFLAIAMTLSISFISWVLQVSYVKDITYKTTGTRGRRARPAPSRDGA